MLMRLQARTSSGLSGRSRHCVGARADVQFELSEALLCADGPVRCLVDLSLAPEHGCGHGALYDGLNHGSIEIARLRRCLASVALPRVGQGIVLAVDVSPWLRPDAETLACLGCTRPLHPWGHASHPHR